MDWSSEFPGLSQSAYLNSCTYGLLPTRSRRAIEAHLQTWTDLPDWDEWAAAVEKARRAFARLLHARDDEIAVLSNASSAISSVMSGLRPTHGRRELLTVTEDFPAAPSLASRQRDLAFTHRHVPLSQWNPTNETSLACVPATVSFTGERIDIAEKTRLAHARGAMLLVDAFQAAGTYDIHAHDLDVDFLVTGVYKWLLAPAGLSFLYVRRDHFDLVPTTSGWQGLAEPYAFDPLGPLAADARRYQQGGLNVLACVGAATSIGLLQEVGLDNIEAHNRKLTQLVIDEANARKWEVFTPDERGSIVTFRVPNQEEALAACKAANVAVNPRLGGIRVSPHFYNRERDVERLFEALDGAS